MRYLLAGVISAILATSAFAQSTRTVWSGCFQVVYVADKTGLVRKLEREEARQTTQQGRPGTGVYGPWRETYCEAPGAPNYSYPTKDWPKAINAHEVLGPTLFHWFQVNNRARVSQTFNLTEFPFSVIGINGTGRLPAVSTPVFSRLQRIEEVVGWNKNGQPTRIYRYKSQ